MNVRKKIMTQFFFDKNIIKKIFEKKNIRKQKKIGGDAFGSTEPRIVIFVHFGF